MLNNAPLNRWTLDAPVSDLEFSSGGHYLWMGHVDCYVGEWVLHLIVSIHLEIILISQCLSGFCCSPTRTGSKQIYCSFRPFVRFPWEAGFFLVLVRKRHCFKDKQDWEGVSWEAEIVERVVCQSVTDGRAAGMVKRWVQLHQVMTRKYACLRVPNSSCFWMFLPCCYFLRREQHGKIAAELL